MSFLKLCKKSPDGKHHWVKWRNETHENTGRTHGPGSHIVFHCYYCGRIKK